MYVDISVMISNFNKFIKPLAYGFYIRFWKGGSPIIVYIHEYILTTNNNNNWLQQWRRKYLFFLCFPLHKFFTWCAISGEDRDEITWYENYFRKRKCFLRTFLNMLKERIIYVSVSNHWKVKDLTTS